MKKFNLILMLLATITMSAQAVMESTYLDVPATKIGKFIELHKKMTDMAQGEDRTIVGSWVYRHWYGSGHSIVIYDQFNSTEDAVKDDFFAALRKNVDKLSEAEQKEMSEVFTEWWSFFNNHTDEMRMHNPETDHVQKPDVDWDIPFVFVVGSYNSSGSEADLAKAYMEWSTKPGVENGLQLGGGSTLHYKGSGSDVQLYGGFKNIKEFAESISNQGTDSPEARAKFWNLVEGSHSDQIYIHVGHLVDGKFNLAGPDN